MPNFLQFITKEGRFFIFSRFVLAFVIGFLSWPVLVYFLDLYDAAFPVKESSAPSLLIFVSLFSLFVFLFFLIRFWVKKPSVKDLAVQIERANPDLMDLLNCAVELEEVSKTRNLSFMEKIILYIFLKL